MKILVTGDRNWTDKNIIKTALSEYGATELIEGEARGADSLAREAAEELGIPVTKVPAKWYDDNGKFRVWAGPERNKWMLDMKPDLVLAFHNDLANSKGTRNCVMQARSKKFRYDVFLFGNTSAAYATKGVDAILSGELKQT